MEQSFTEKYGPVEVRALSIKQPYASLMLHGKSETRTWNTQYRGWVLLCATKHPYSKTDVIGISDTYQFKRIDETLCVKNFDYRSLLPTEQAFAVGYLTETTLMDDYASNDTMVAEIEDKCFVRFRSGLWMHEYTVVQPIQPFQWKGQQGWKIIDEETKSKIIIL